MRNAQGGTEPQWLLNQCKGDVLAGFWGDVVEIDDGARMTWMREPHYYPGQYWLLTSWRTCGRGR